MNEQNKSIGLLRGGKRKGQNISPKPKSSRQTNYTVYPSHLRRLYSTELLRYLRCTNYIFPKLHRRVQAPWQFEDKQVMVTRSLLMPREKGRNSVLNHRTRQAQCKELQLDQKCPSQCSLPSHKLGLWRQKHSGGKKRLLLNNTYDSSVGWSNARMPQWETYLDTYTIYFA